MSDITTLIRVEAASGLSFGNHELATKNKVDDFEVNGDIYKLKTFKTMTKLEKNGRLLYESVPGTTVQDFIVEEKAVTFTVWGLEDAQVTVELESDQAYKLFIDDTHVGKMTSNISGKLTFSVDFENGANQVTIVKA